MSSLTLFNQRSIVGQRQVASCCRMVPTPSLPVKALRMRAPARLSVAAHGFMATLGNERRGSLDPMAASWANPVWRSAEILTVKSPQQFDELVAGHPDKLIVLMAKSHSCRPCKMFHKRYMSIAQRFPECIICEMYGDETPETRKMMIRLQVKVTPTFRMYRQKECVNVMTGTNEKKLMRGMLAHLFPAELVNHEREIQETMVEEDEQAAAEKQPAAATP